KQQSTAASATYGVGGESKWKTLRIRTRPLLDVVAGDPPLTIFIQHRSDRFDCCLLVLEAAVVLNHHVFAIWRSRHCRFIGCAFELAGEQLAQRFAARSQSIEDASRAAPR